MPTRQDFKLELYRMMDEAIHQGKATADINAGELHRRVGGYPSKKFWTNHRADRVASLTIRYVLRGLKSVR